jgi:zinc transporter, ZIP family
VLEALGWGLLSQSSLLLAGLLVCWVTFPTKLVGVLGGFGAGAMIAAVSFDLVPQAQVGRRARVADPRHPVGSGSTISLSFVAAVFISNLPQAIAPSADLHSSGWGARRLGVLWLLVVVACGIAAGLGFLFTDATADAQGDRAAAPAAGGILAMLTNSLMPFSFERGGAMAGAATAVGFCLSVLNS